MATAAAIETATLHLSIDIDKLVPSKTNPRKSYDEAELDGLAQSIKTNGLLHPILVRKHPGNHGRFEIVCGERRFRAAKKAKLDRLDATVRDMADAQVIELQLIENLQREDVSALDEANGFAALMALDPKVYTIDALAARVNKSRRYVYASLQMAKLEKPVLELLQENAILPSHAVLIAPLTAPLQTEVAKGLRERFKRDGEVMSVRAFGNYVGRNLLQSLSAAPWKKDDATMPTHASIKYKGACSACPFNTSVDKDAYPDEPKDRCMVKPCYELHMGTHLERAAAALKAKTGKPVITLVQDYVNYQERQEQLKKGAKLMSTYEPGGFAEVKSTAAGAVQALVVAGDDRGILKWVKKNEGSRGVVSPGRSAADIEKEQARIKADNLKRRVDVATYRQLTALVLQKTKLDASILRRALTQIIQRHYNAKDVVATLGMLKPDEKKAFTKYSGLDTFLTKHTKDMTVDQLAGCINAALVFTLVNQTPTDLMAECSRLHIDTKAVREQVKIDLAPKAKPATVKAPAKAKTKTSTKKR